MIVVWENTHPVIVGHVGRYDPKRNHLRIKESLKLVSHYRLSRLRKSKIPRRLRKAK